MPKTDTTDHQAPATGPHAPEGAPALSAVEPRRPHRRVDPAVGRRKGGSVAGRTPRAVALIGLGEELPTVSLKTHADRMAILEAVAAAVARGKTSGLVAQTLLAAVREARAEATSELEALAQAQAQEIERLRGGLPHGR